MISLHVTIYDLGEGDQFKVMAADGEGDPIDVTDQYDIAAIQTEDGQSGFAVLKRVVTMGDCPHHPTGAEL